MVAKARGEEFEGEEVDPESDLGKLIKAGEGLELNFDGKENVQATTKAVMEVVRGQDGLDLPEDEDQLRNYIGPFLMNHIESSAEDILKGIAKKYGWKLANAQKVEAKEKAMADSCAEPKNGPVLTAIEELAELYFKSGNGNAGATYKKVAAAIKEVDYEITAENALGLGKGRNKVAVSSEGATQGDLACFVMSNIHAFSSTPSGYWSEEFRANSCK